eukprot:gnl/TRDRNA2_/TRDRNA2_61185_c0_seq1.p1 gnl/TRDRNA2_/TRDRNA2_61185_c0~~gnl/TRDRNA2_/TRDRNA2_61185_c0_seq1.p1  ORF type:complete len:376 (+),score=85.83 gnl/TRDRNA2_/TRDRNA2_61185_c0_seq1:23-1129(+)
MAGAGTTAAAPVAAGNSTPSSSTALAKPCKYGCGRVAATDPEGKRVFDTCCRTCAMCKGAGSHDAKCTGGSVASTTALAPIGTELAVIEESVEAYTGEAGSGSDAASAPDAQAALRSLGLDDAWPTELTMKEIRRRYMREALTCHPDKGPENEKESRTLRFQELAAAYALLEVTMAVLERSHTGEQDAPGGPGAAGPAGSSAAAPSGTLPIEAGQAALPASGAPAQSAAGRLALPASDAAVGRSEGTVAAPTAGGALALEDRAAVAPPAGGTLALENGAAVAPPAGGTLALEDGAAVTSGTGGVPALTDAPPTAKPAATSADVADKPTTESAPAMQTMDGSGTVVIGGKADGKAPPPMKKGPCGCLFK